LDDPFSTPTLSNQNKSFTQRHMFPVIQPVGSSGARKDILIASNTPSKASSHTIASTSKPSLGALNIKEDPVTIMKRFTDNATTSGLLSKQQQRPLALGGGSTVSATTPMGSGRGNTNNISSTSLLSASGLLDESSRSNNSFSSLSMVPSSPSAKKNSSFHGMSRGATTQQQDCDTTPKLSSSMNNGSSNLLSSIVLSTSTNSATTANVNNNSFSSSAPAASLSFGGPSMSVAQSASPVYCCPKALRQQQAKPVNRSPFDPKMYLPLIPPAKTAKKHQILLAIDLDETLVHAVSGDRVASSAYPTASMNSPSRKNTGSSNNSSVSSLITCVAGGPSSASSLNNSQRVHDLIIRFDGASTTSTTPKDGEQHFQQQLSTPTKRSSGRSETICVQFRPHTKAFLEYVTERFEVMIFTASHRSYADPVCDALDALCGGALQGCTRLYREHCADLAGSKVKDLSLLGRPLHRVALLDNSPTSYYFQPRCGIPVESWFDDHQDDALLRLCPMLERLAASLDVVDVLDEHNAIVSSNN
jgi:Dullard-like phosphatase family protein